MKLPLLRPVAYPDDGAIPLDFAGRGRSPILESSERGAFGGGHSFVLWEPFWTMRFDFATGWESEAGPSARHLPADPFEGLEAALARCPLAGEPEGRPAFTGGAVGYFSYELASALERLPQLALRRTAVPASRWAIGDVVLLLDHARRRAVLASHGWPASGPARLLRAAERLAAASDAWQRALASAATAASAAPAPVSGPPDAPDPAGDLDQALGHGLVASLDAAEYASRFRRLHRYLEEGHVYQANLSLAFRAEHAVDANRLYDSLRRVNRAPYAAFLPGVEADVLSASPELFLSRRGSHLVTRPIKGTRPRGGDAADDARLAAELCASAKDLAEHVMIVDVHRNDLGRVARYGTVRVTDRWALESFASVHHLTSTVEAEARSGLRPLDPVRAAFPAGSITGAPKVRAMEILAELEPHARGVYTGALGWIAPGGDCELAVAIRTLTVTPNGVEFPAGGGIVLDSTAGAEYEEAWVKARALWAAVRAASAERHPAVATPSLATP